MWLTYSKTFLVLLVAFCLQYSPCLALESDVSPCYLFMGENGTDSTLVCEQRNTTQGQIKNALNNLRGEGTIKLKLYQVNLGVIPSDFFKGHDIKVLTIDFCDLQSLAGGYGRILEGLEETLESLMIKGSALKENEFQSSALSHLRKLKHIEFESNNFEEIGNGWFKNAPASLESVWLQNNNIKRLGDRAFADISNLSFLRLSGNSLRQVSRNMLPNPANKLWGLELDDNKITSFPEDMFTNMPKLERVNISSNLFSKNYWLCGAKLLGGAALAIGGATVALPLVGFTAAGVGGGTVAATVQAYIGNVAAGSAFAAAQSAGVVGLAAGIKAAIGAAGAAVVSFVC